MARRSQRILALLPPPESEDSNLESDDDPESILATRENIHHDSVCSSPPRSLPSGMSDFLDDIIERDDEEMLEQPGPNAVNSPMNIATEQHSTPSLSIGPSPLINEISGLSPCIIPETPSTSSVRTPLALGIRIRRAKKYLRNDQSPIPQPSPLLRVVRKRKMQKLEFAFKKCKYTGAVDVSASTIYEIAERDEVELPLQ